MLDSVYRPLGLAAMLVVQVCAPPRVPQQADLNRYLYRFCDNVHSYPSVSCNLAPSTQPSHPALCGRSPCSPLCVQDAAILLSCACLAAAAASPAPLAGTPLFGAMIALAMLEKLASISSELAIERDWVTQLAGGWFVCVCVCSTQRSVLGVQRIVLPPALPPCPVLVGQRSLPAAPQHIPTPTFPSPRPSTRLPLPWRRRQAECVGAGAQQRLPAAH